MKKEQGLKIALSVLGIAVLVLGAFLIFGNKKEVNKPDETIKTYTVTFNTDGGSEVNSIIVNENETFTLPEEPKREGFKFNGWLVDGELYNEAPLTKDLELTANWLREEAKTFMITFKLDNGSKDIKVLVEENSVVNKPKTPTKKGYTFTNWYLKNKVYNFNTKITKNITLIAKYKKMDAPSSSKTPETPSSSKIPDTPSSSQAVDVPVTNINLNEVSKTINRGQTFRFIATVLPANATNKKVTWTSKNEAIVTIDSSGNITPIKAGETTIEATSANGKKVVATVKVTNNVLSIKLNYNRNILYFGGPDANPTYETFPKGANYNNNPVFYATNMNGMHDALGFNQSTGIVKFTKKDSPFTQGKIWVEIDGVKSNVIDITGEKELCWEGNCGANWSKTIKVNTPTKFTFNVSSTFTVGTNKEITLSPTSGSSTTVTGTKTSYPGNFPSFNIKTPGGQERTITIIVN